MNRWHAVEQRFLSSDKDGRDRIGHLRNEISELRAAAEPRIRELEEAEESVQNHTKILSAVRRTPAEIVCEIFSQTLPHTRRLGKLTVEQAPWRLGHICRRWRAASTGCPSLWSSIILDSSWDDTSFPLPMVETQLRRSGNAPLTITVNCEGGVIAEGLEALKSAPNLKDYGFTIPHLRRNPSDDGPHVVLPHLRRMSIVARYNFLAYVTAPSLQELWICDSPENYVTSANTLLNCIQRSSYQLVKLVVHGCFEPSSLIPLLQAIPTLTTLFIIFET
ncbi:hypothetical protein DFH06DRAFT_1415652 [Mycena polygramma]|nr:hypothetical protein DFH06DRAFT_1415652 [Mycena polygramma]